MFKKHTPSPTIYPEELELSVSWIIFQNFGTISSTNFFCSSAFKKINRDHTFRIYTVFLCGGGDNHRKTPFDGMIISI